MPLTQIAVCREALDDGADWSLYFVSAFDTAVDVVVTAIVVAACPDGTSARNASDATASVAAERHRPRPRSSIVAPMRPPPRKPSTVQPWSGGLPRGSTGGRST